MFKDDFKKANDSIHADEKLVERILSQKPSKNRPEIYWKKYAPVAAAAVVVLSTSIAILPKMLDDSTDGIIYSTVSTSAPSQGFARSGIVPHSDPEPVQTEIPRPADDTNAEDKTDSKAETQQIVPILHRMQSGSPQSVLLLRYSLRMLRRLSYRKAERMKKKVCRKKAAQRRKALLTLMKDVPKTI